MFLYNLRYNYLFCYLFVKKILKIRSLEFYLKLFIIFVFLDKYICYKLMVVGIF